LSQDRFELAGSPQFDVDVFGVRQKSKQQRAPGFNRKISKAALARIASRNNERSAKPGNFGFGVAGDRRERIETKFEKIGRLPDCNGGLEIGPRGYDGHESGPAYFTGSARCHILADWVSGERWTALF